MPAFDGADATAIAQMAAYYPQGAQRYAQLFRQRAADIVMAGTVKTVAANAQLGVIAPGRDRASLRRRGLVKGGIKTATAGTAGNSWRKRRMPSALTGLCNGASSAGRSISRRVSSQTSAARL